MRTINHLSEARSSRTLEWCTTENLTPGVKMPSGARNDASIRRNTTDMSQLCKRRTCTVMTPSLPTRSMAEAISSPISASLKGYRAEQTETKNNNIAAEGVVERWRGAESERALVGGKLHANVYMYVADTGAMAHSVVYRHTYKKHGYIR